MNRIKFFLNKLKDFVLFLFHNINWFVVILLFLFIYFLPNYWWIFVAFLLFYNLFYFGFRNRFIINMFKRFSLLVCGKKGTGKDVLFSYAYNSISKKKYNLFSNIPYDDKPNLCYFKDFSLATNFSELIETELSSCSKTDYNPKFDNSICFMSDTGVYLSSANFSSLNKLYPSLPIYVALNRQLYSQNIHCNTQAFNRVWDKYREQFDFYINIRSNFNAKMRRSLFSIFKSYKLKLDIYTNINDAINLVLPRKKKKDNNSSMIYGNIKTINVVIPFYKIKHNTKYFRNLLDC